MLPRTGSPSIHFLCVSETSSMPIGLNLVTKNHSCALRIREASCCETTTVLTVTAVPSFTRKAQAPAVKAHSSLSIIEDVQYNAEAISQQTKPSMEVTIATETLLQSEMAGIEAAAAEAVALAKAAVKAAREVVALSEGQTTLESEYLKDIPSEADLLRIERARLTEMERLEDMNFSNRVQLFEIHSEEECESQSPSSSSSTPALGRECNISEQNAANSSVSPWQKTYNIKARSSRQMERRARRVRAAEKAATVASTISPTRSSRKVKKAVASNRYTSDSIRLLRDPSSSKLLTASEEVELSRGIQDLIKLDKIRAKYKEKTGKEPTLAQWAEVISIDQTTLKRRLQVGWDSFDKIINCNVRLVISVAKNYQNRGLSLQDLIQAGSMGLMRSAEKFDHSRGFKFSTYAYWWIRQSISKALTEQSRTIRLPVHIVESMNRIRASRRLLYQEHRRDPTKEEVAEVAGMTLSRLRHVTRCSRSPISLDRPVRKDMDEKFSDIVADTDSESTETIVNKELFKKDLDKVLDTLTEKEKQMVRLRYGLDDGRMKSLHEVGDHFSLSRERVRQIEVKALSKLRQNHRTQNLKHYIDI